MSRGISKQDLASIAEHALELSHGANSPNTGPNGPTYNTNASAGPSAQGSASTSANSSFNNYSNITSTPSFIHPLSPPNSLTTSTTSSISSPYVASSLPSNFSTPAMRSAIRMSDSGLQFGHLSPTISNAASTNNSPRSLESSTLEATQVTPNPDMANTPSGESAKLLNGETGTSSPFLYTLPLMTYVFVSPALAGELEVQQQPTSPAMHIEVTSLGPHPDIASTGSPYIFDSFFTNLFIISCTFILCFNLSILF